MSRFALVVQHHPADPPGAIARALGARGIEPRDVRGFAGDEVPSTVRDAAGIVVMGGPFSVDDVDAHPYLRSELALIASAIQARIPVLGVCLGAQLLARALGGGVSRGVAPEIGWLPVERVASVEPDPLFEGIPSHFVPFHWHADAIVLPAGAGATRLACSTLAEVQAFRVGPPTSGVYGFQFHLEGDGAMIEAMLRGFGDELRERKIDGDSVRADTRVHLAEQERLAGIVFGRWADAVARARM